MKKPSYTFRITGVLLSAIGCVWQNISTTQTALAAPASFSASPGRPPEKPQKSENAYSSIVEAVKKNNLIAVKTLLNKGANPNARNSAGSPILTVAASRGYVLIVQALLDKRADPNIKGQKGTKQEGSTALIGAVTNRHIEIVKLLISKGADVNAACAAGNLQGATAIILAAIGGNTSIVKVLIEAGANVNAQQFDGNTAIQQAASEGHKVVVEMLLKKRANVDSRNWLGTTPLMAAAMGGHLDMVKFLIAKGANVNARDDNTRRLYGQAAFIGDTQAQKQLEKSGKLNVRREDGASVLDWAKVGRSKEIIELLKQAGAKE